jgi:DNA-binding transcriptional LysR family regulator
MSILTFLYVVGHMEILQLEHFIAVVEEGTFTRAAERVCRTQPAVSQSIKRLEDELGTTLFARDAPVVLLTHAGELLLAYARRMINLRKEARGALDDLKCLNSGRVAIAAHESAAMYLLPGPIKTFLDRFPDVKVGVYRNRVDDIPAQVADREIDIGFVTEAPRFRDLRVLQVYVDAMILVASPRHHLVQQQQDVTVKALGQERFVTNSLCVRTAEKIARAFKESDTPYRVAVELGSFEAVKDFVQQDVGLAILPRLSVLPQLHSGKLVQIPIHGLDIPRRTTAVFRDRRYMPEASRELLSTIRGFDWTRLLLPPFAERYLSYSA